MDKIHVEVAHQFIDAEFDLNLELPSKGITAIFGRSGAGKTTVINMIAGLTTPDQGKIVVNRETLYCSQTKINLPTYKRKVGYVFQDSRLFPHYSVKGNLLYGVKAFDQAHFDEIISLLALESLLERLPVDLSGGEKQRVAIGRALLSKPDILLMDEPLASLDCRVNVKLCRFLKSSQIK